MRLCLIGPTGSGKSTVARYIAKSYNAEIIKIAEPLYEMQHRFYEQLGKHVAGQDGELLQFLGSKIEKERPGWLTKTFLEKVLKSNSNLIVNDDCRPHSYDELSAAQFIFVRISTERQTRKARLRTDHVSIDPSHPVELGFENLHAHHEIDNDGDFEKTKHQVDCMMSEIFGGSFGWLTGQQILQERRNGRILIEPFDVSCINANSYNYHISRTLMRLTSEVVDLKKEDEVESVEIPESGYLLKPFELYLGSTVESFGSSFFASLITGRSSVGRKFVTNHITAGLIDQGFVGTITLEIVVHRPTIIYPNMKFGQIFWFTTFGLPHLYDGKYTSQSGPTRSKLHEDH